MNDHIFPSRICTWIRVLCWILYWEEFMSWDWPKTNEEIDAMSDEEWKKYEAKEIKKYDGQFKFLKYMWAGYGVLILATVIFESVFGRNL